MFDRHYPSTCARPAFTTFPSTNFNPEWHSEAEMRIRVPPWSSVWLLPQHVLQELQNICNKGNILLFEIPLLKHVIMKEWKLKYLIRESIGLI
jgi:hypothetical protein